MSTTDKRIVKMQFDNAQFEAGVSKSMSTLDKLKAKLNFSDSAKDISKLQTSIDNVDFSKMQTSLQFLEKRFSATGEFIYKIWDGITDKAINAFKRVESATLGQIKNGGWARALNIANAQFQTAGLGASWEAIKAAADYAVTDTAYGLDEAAKTASQLLASGIDYQEVIEETEEGGLTQMHKALRAISGVAAMTNSSYSEIAHIFTRIAGSNRVFGEDLNSIAARGLNAASVLAKAFNTTEAEIRDMVSKGQISFNDFAMAMDDAYGEHAKQANETFQGAMSNMRAALSRIGAIFAQPVIDKTNRFFNAITGRIKEVQRALSDVKLEEGDLSPRFATHFAEAWDSAVTAAVNFVNAIDLDWFHDVSDTMDNIAIKMKSFFDWVNEGFAQQSEELEVAAEESEESLKDMVASQAEYQAAMHILFKDKTLTGNKRVKWLEQQGLNPQRVQKYIDSVIAAGWNVNKASIKVQDSIDETKDSVVSLGSEIDKLPKSFEEFDRMEQAGQDQFLKDHQKLIRAYRDRDNWIQEITEKEQEAADEMKAYIAVSEEYRKIKGWSKDDWRGDFLDERMTEKRKKELFEKYPQLLDKFNEVKNERKYFEGIAAVFFNISGSISNIATNIKTIIRAGKNAFRNVFNVDTVLPGLIEFTDKFYELTDALLITEGGEAKLQGGFEILFTIIRGGIGLVGRLAMKLMDIVIWIANVIKGTSEANQNAEKSTSIISSLWKIISKTAGSIKDLILNFSDFIDMVKNTEGVQRLGKAVSDLGKRFKKDMDPASDSLAGFADSYEGLSIEGLANAIGWIADKIAWLVEQIPKLLDVAQKAFNAISSFVTDIWDKVTGWFDGKDAGSIFDEIKKRIIGAWQYTEDIGENIGTFFGKVWDVIKSALSGLDFDTLKDVGKAAALILGIYEILNLFHSMSGVLSSVSSVIGSFDSFLSGITEMISNFGHGFTIFATASLIQSIAWLFVGIAAFLAIASSIKEEALIRGTAILIIVSVFVLSIVKTVKKLQATHIEGKNINKINIQVFNGLISFAALVAAVALAMRWIIAAINDLSTQMDEKGTDKVVASFIMVGLLLAGVMVGTALIAKTINKMESANVSTLHGKVSKTLVATALMIAALGVSVKLMVGAIGTLADIIQKAGVENTFMAFGIAASMLILMAVSMKLVINGITDIITAAGNSTGKMVAAVVLMAVFGVTVVGIIAELAYIAALGRFIFNRESVLQVLALVGGTLLAIGGMVALIGLGAKMMKGKNDSLLDVALIMAIAVAGIAIIVYQMRELMKTISGMDSSKAFGSMGIVVGAIAVFVGGVALILGILTKAMNKENSKVTSGDILIIAASLVVIATAFMVFAKAIEIMSGLNIDRTVIWTLISFVGVMAALATVGSIVKNFGDVFLKLGIGFTAAGLGVFLLGLGLKAIGVGLGYFALGLAKLNGVINKNILIFMTLLVAALWAIALVVKTVVGPLSDGISGIVKGIGNLAGGLMGALDKILQNIPDLVEQIIEFIKMIGKPIAGAIKDLVKPIWNGIKSVLNKLKTWYDNLPEQARRKLVRIIVGIISVLEAVAPDVITSFLRILFKILDTIAEHAYMIVNKLVQFVVIIIHNLAEAIARNAHVIGNAFKAVLYALLTILAEAINVVFGWIPGVSSWLKDFEAEGANQIRLLTAESKSWITEMNRQDEAMQKNLGTTKDLKDIISEYAGELGFAKTGIEDLTKAEEERADSLAKKSALSKKIEGFNFSNVDVVALSKSDKATYDAIKDLSNEELTNYVNAHYDEVDRLMNNIREKAKNRYIKSWEDFESTYGYTKEYFDNQATEVIKYRSKNEEGYLEAYNTYLSLLDEEIELDKKYGNISGKIFEYSQDAEKNSFLASQHQKKTLGRLQSYYGYSTSNMTASELTERLKNDKAFKEAYDKEAELIRSRFDDAYYNRVKPAIDKQREMLESLEKEAEENKKKKEEIEKSLYDWALEPPKSTIKTPNDYLNDYADDLMEKNYVDHPAKAISETAKKIPKEFYDVMNSNESRQKIQKAFSDGFVGPLNSKIVEIKDTGRNYDAGLVEGVLDPPSMASVANAGSFIGRLLYNATNNELGVRSPSKVMAETGKFSILGLIQGLTDNADYLNQTSAQIGDAMIVSFGAPFERIAQMASGKIPYNPSITPVLDPTSIANGASSIYSMFQGQTVQLDGYTGRLAADISGVSNQNDAIVEQLQELRNDMNDMTETILGMQIVLDSGTVVGELSDGFDYSLGTASIRRQRGN